MSRVAGDLRFRLGDEADAGAVTLLVNRAYRVGGERAWTTEADLVGGPRVRKEEVEALAREPGTRLLLGELDGRLVASARLRKTADGTVELGLLAVDPASQAVGVGRALLAQAEALAARELGARRIVLRVVGARGELVAWYERRGWRRTGRSERFEPREGARFLRGPLEFAEMEKVLDTPVDAGGGQAGS